jgi:hypothetical protein
MIDAVTFKKLKTQPETLCHGSGSEGAFSTVYEGPIPNTVVKVGRTTDDGWLFWAAYVMTLQNPEPWMPRILALHIDERTDNFQAILEALTPTQCPNRPSCCGGFPDVINGKKAYVQNVPVVEASSVRMHLEAIQRITDEAEPFYFDAHVHNWMMRGDQIVLTDPFAFVAIDMEPHLYAMATQSRGRITFNETQS